MIPPDQYAYILQNLPIVCVDVAILFHGKVLLIKRNDEPAKGEWWLPGGRLFKGETLEDCALRKAIEEVGLNCELIQAIYHASTDFGSVHSVNFCYLLRAKDDNVVLDSHSSAYKWIDDVKERYHPYVFNCLIRCMAYA